jgi:hypothetical protein
MAGRPTSQTTKRYGSCWSLISLDPVPFDFKLVDVEMAMMKRARGKQGASNPVSHMSHTITNFSGTEILLGLAYACS